MDGLPDFAQAMNDMISMYQKRREEVGTVQKQLSTTTASVTSERRLLTITVGAHGQLTKLTFNSNDYQQLGPRELARVIVDTAAKAYEAAQAKLGTKLTKELAGSDMLPTGVSVTDLLAGRVDPMRMLPENIIDPALLQKLRDANPMRPSPVRQDPTRAGVDDE